MQTTILAIESSCDETSAAVLQNGRVLSNVIATQDIHKQYGGVVPELASRAHQQNIIPVVDQAIQQAGINKSELNALGFTRGPGPWSCPRPLLSKRVSALMSWKKLQNQWPWALTFHSLK